MAMNTITEKAKELAICKPKPFTGDRNKTNKFLQKCQLYLQINEDAYDSDEKKIGFILTLMEEGEAGEWSEQYIMSKVNANTGKIVLPTYRQFIDKLRDDFKQEDRIGGAMQKLKNLQQGNQTVEELVTEFRLLVSQAGLHNVLLGKVEQQSIMVPITFPIVQNEESKIVGIPALIDCGAGGKFIDQNFARGLGLELTPLKRPLPVKNVDGTPNKAGTIKFKVRLFIKIGNRNRFITLLVSGLGKQKVILGLPGYGNKTPISIGRQEKLNGEPLIDQPERRNRNEIGRSNNGLLRSNPNSPDGPANRLND